MFRTTGILLFRIYLLPIYSQSWDEVQKNSKVYLSGDGWGTTVEEADQQALAALISQISVAVSSNVTITDEEKNLNGKIDGVTYSHIINPVTGSALNENDAVIVISDKGYYGDAMSTSLMINTVDEIKEIEKEHEIKTIVIKDKKIIYSNEDIEVLYR